MKYLIYGLAIKLLKFIIHLNLGKQFWRAPENYLIVLIMIAQRFKENYDLLENMKT
jgi:hypothetical protein